MHSSICPVDDILTHGSLLPAGTPDYMSPQLTAAKVQGKALYDGTKADVWALGALVIPVIMPTP